MKNKLYRHLAFWLASCVQGTLIEYAWVHTIFSNEPQINIITQAFLFNLAFMPSRLFFTYYALHTVAKTPFKGNYKVGLIFFKLSIALCVAIIMHRVATACYIVPHEYPGRVLYTWQIIFNFPWMLVTVLDIGYTAGAATAIKLFRMQIVSLKNEKELIRGQLESELKFLKNQINPHFLFNTLNNIYALARKKSNETPEVVVRLANLLRFMLYESAKDTIPISQEMRILDDYVQLEKIRYSKRLEICFTKDIDDHTQLISPLILLPFIENAFKHGVNDTIDSTIITIDATVRNGQLDFVVKNTHNQNCTGQLKENIGLSNVRRQLELTYADFSLDITNLEQTFLVDLKINLNSYGKL